MLQYEQQSLLGSIGVVSSKHVEELAPAKPAPPPSSPLSLSPFLPVMLAASVQSRPGLSSPVQSLFCFDQPALSGTENLAEWYAIESVILPGNMESSGGAV